MAEKKVKQVVRIFTDGSAELLEGKSLDNFIAQESAALSLLMSHSWANPKKGKIKWIPIKEIQIIR